MEVVWISYISSRVFLSADFWETVYNSSVDAAEHGDNLIKEKQKVHT